MATPLLPAFIPAPAHKRKRARSSLEIMNFSSSSSPQRQQYQSCDTKRARIGIQELTTDETPISPPSSSSAQSRYSSGICTAQKSVPLQPIPNPTLRCSSPETQDDRTSSSGLESTDDDDDKEGRGDGEETTSSSGDDSQDDDGGGGVDGGYDSDSESGSTTTSSSSSSSDGNSDDDDEHDDGTQDKVLPRIDLARTMGIPLLTQRGSATSTTVGKFSGICSNTTSSLTARLSSFLPRLAKANRELDEERAKGVLQGRNIETIDEDGGRYIEMNLGLGVLEETQDDGSSHDSDNDGDDDEAGSVTGTPNRRTQRKTKKYDAMATLMGKKGGKQPDIQVVDDTG